MKFYAVPSKAITFEAGQTPDAEAFRANLIEHLANDELRDEFFAVDSLDAAIRYANEEDPDKTDNEAFAIFELNVSGQRRSLSNGNVSINEGTDQEEELDGKFVPARRIEFVAAHFGHVIENAQAVSLENIKGNELVALRDSASSEEDGAEVEAPVIADEPEQPEPVEPIVVADEPVVNNGGNAPAQPQQPENPAEITPEPEKRSWGKTLFMLGAFLAAGAGLTALGIPGMIVAGASLPLQIGIGMGLSLALLTAFSVTAKVLGAVASRLRRNAPDAGEEGAEVAPELADRAAAVNREAAELANAQVNADADPVPACCAGNAPTCTPQAAASNDEQEPEVAPEAEENRARTRVTARQ